MFVIYVSNSPVTPIMQVHPFYQAQVRILLVNKALIKILSKYLDYIDVFLFDLTIKLFENTNIYDYVIQLAKNKQLSYRPIYSLGSVELKTLKIYIKIHLKTGFFQLSKSLTNAPIIFNQKLDKNLRFYIYYLDLNNLTIKNQYFSVSNR